MGTATQDKINLYSFTELRSFILGILSMGDNNYGWIVCESWRHQIGQCMCIVCLDTNIFLHSLIAGSFFLTGRILQQAA